MVPKCTTYLAFYIVDEICSTLPLEQGRDVLILCRSMLVQLVRDSAKDSLQHCCHPVEHHEIDIRVHDTLLDLYLPLTQMKSGIISTIFIYIR